MSEASLVVGDADASLRDRLDAEIYTFNTAATGHHDGRSLTVAVRGDDGDLSAGLHGWTWAGCGYSSEPSRTTEGEDHHDLRA
jgi:hypothetical protein